ncbi:MAG: hypothetical protein R6U98_29285 [Pirellulaceae bacterium]
MLPIGEPSGVIKLAFQLLNVLLANVEFPTDDADVCDGCLLGNRFTLTLGGIHGKSMFTENLCNNLLKTALREIEGPRDREIIYVARIDQSRLAAGRANAAVHREENLVGKNGTGDEADRKVVLTLLLHKDGVGRVSRPVFYSA